MSLIRETHRDELTLPARHARKPLWRWQFMQIGYDCRIRQHKRGRRRDRPQFVVQLNPRDALNLRNKLFLLSRLLRSLPPTLFPTLLPPFSLPAGRTWSSALLKCALHKKMSSEIVDRVACTSSMSLLKGITTNAQVSIQLFRRRFVVHFGERGTNRAFAR